MADANIHEVNFQWPYTHPSTVIVTGTFDGWSKTQHMKKTSTGFEAKVKMGWGQTIKYKFIVDGQWLVDRNKPIDVEPGSGFVNNSYTAPPKPPVAPVAVGANGHADAAANGEKALNGHASPATAKAGPTSNDTTNLASTIVASHGTNSALQYVATGFGAAVQTVVGIDPINSQKIALPTPKPEDKFDRPFEVETTSNTSAPQPTTTADKMDVTQPTSPIAPIVPIMIVPVNAPENSTVPSSPPTSKGPVAAPADVSEIAPPSEVVDEAAETTKEVVLKVEEQSTHGPIVTDTSPQPIVAQLKTAEANPVEESTMEPIDDATTALATPAKEESATKEPTSDKIAENHTDKDETAAVPEPETTAATVEKPEATAATVEKPETTAATVEKPESPKAAENTTPVKTPPATPSKAQVFPTSDKSPTSSPSKSLSRFSSIRSTSTKRKSSLLTKLKHVFTKDKDKEHTKESK